MCLCFRCCTNLNVKFVDPDGKVGIGVEIEVIDGFLDSVEDVGECLVIKHAGFQRADLQVNFLLNQQKVIHLKIKI